MDMHTDLSTKMFILELFVIRKIQQQPKHLLVGDSEISDDTSSLEILIFDVKR